MISLSPFLSDPILLVLDEPEELVDLADTLQPPYVVCVGPELEFVKLNPIAVLLVLQNRYSQSCIAIGFRRCYVLYERKRSNSLNL
jgi:hypothetical protein